MGTPGFIRHDACPVCGAADIGEIGLNETYFIRPFGQEVTIHIANCGNCDFLFQIDPPDLDSLTYYYNQSFQYRHGEPEIVEEYVHAQQAAFMAGEKSLRDKSVLEIGSSTGRFLSHLKVLHGCRTWFDELNLEAKRYLVELQGHNDVAHADPGDSFDFIVMRHVLEHITDPVGYLRDLRPRLGADSVLFIEVPDFSFIDPATDTLLFEHVNYFSAATLARALDAAGYVVAGLSFEITDNYATCSDRVLRARAHVKPAHLADGSGRALRAHLDSKVGSRHAVLKRIVDELGADQRIAFYAASWWTERALLNVDLDRSKVLGIFDKDSKKIGTTYHGLEVFSPDRVTELAPDVIFVLTSFEPQIKRDLQAMGYRGRVIGWSDLTE